MRVRRWFSYLCIIAIRLSTNSSELHLCIVCLSVRLLSSLLASWAASAKGYVVAKIGFFIYDGIHRETAVSARQVFGAVSTTRIHYTNIYVLKRPDEPYPAWRALSDLICAYMSPLRNHGKLATHRPRPFNVAEAMGRSAFIILPYP